VLLSTDPDLRRLLEKKYEYDYNKSLTATQDLESEVTIEKEVVPIDEIGNVSDMDMSKNIGERSKW